MAELGQELSCLAPKPICFATMQNASFYSLIFCALGFPQTCYSPLGRFQPVNIPLSGSLVGPSGPSVAVSLPKYSPQQNDFCGISAKAGARQSLALEGLREDHVPLCSPIT